MELEIRVSFLKNSEFREGGLNPETPLGTPLTDPLLRSCYPFHSPDNKSPLRLPAPTVRAAAMHIV
jgi:hypothetical protein